MNTMHRTTKRIGQIACLGFVVRSRFTTKNSHRIACLINDAKKSIVAGLMIWWSRRRIEMAAQKENLNESKKHSIIVSLPNLGPFSFPRKHMHHSRYSWFDLQRNPLWSSMLTKKTSKVKALTNCYVRFGCIWWHRRRQCDRQSRGIITLLSSIVLFELFFLYKPSNVPITGLVHAIHSAGLFFKKMSIFTPIIFGEIVEIYSLLTFGFQITTPMIFSFLHILIILWPVSMSHLNFWRGPIIHTWVCVSCNYHTNH